MLYFSWFSKNAIKIKNHWFLPRETDTVYSLKLMPNVYENPSVICKILSFIMLREDNIKYIIYCKQTKANVLIYTITG